jgi:hypothetical protein
VVTGQYRHRARPEAADGDHDPAGPARDIAAARVAQVTADQPGTRAQADQARRPHPPLPRGLGIGQRQVAVDFRRLADLPFALPGTVADRMTRCGYPGCRCRADPPQPHGPYHQWTRKKNGRTATRILTDDQLADYAPWFDNHKRLRELVAELEEISLAIAENDPRWNR